MKTAIFLGEDGAIKDVAPRNEHDFGLEETQQMLSAEYVESVRLATGHHMIFDEAGKRKGRPINLTATFLLHEAGASYLDYVAGDALIVAVDDQGNMLPYREGVDHEGL